MPAKKTTKSKGSRTGKEWTIMVYMAGDNDLSEDMITALKAMKAFGGSQYVNIVALYDSNYPPVPVTFYDFSKEFPPKAGRPQVPNLSAYADVEIVRDILGLPPLPPPNPDLPDPFKFDPAKEFVPLKRFVSWILRQRKYKAKKYALILSGHSDSVIGKTILRDDNPPNVLTLSKLAGVLEDCRKALPKNTHPSHKFDLIGFDGCLMGMLEGAYELKDIADYMVASEGNIPDSGWDYTSVFSELARSSGKVDAKSLALSIASHYKDFNFDYIPSGRSINISAFKLDRVNTFARILNRIAGELYKLLDFDLKKQSGQHAVEESILRERFVDVVLKSHYNSQTFMHNQAVDIMDFLYCMISEWYYLSEQAKALYPNKLTAVFNKEFSRFFNNCISLFSEYPAFVIESCFAGAEYQFSKGVSLFFPWSQMALNLLSSEYGSLKFDRQKRNWRKFFSKYVELTMRTPETKSFLEFVQGQKKAVAGQKLPPVPPSFLVQFAAAKDKTGREYIGREYIGREYIGRGGEFYEYFEQMRNYSHFRVIRRPPPPHNEVDLSGCNELPTI